MSDSNLNKNFIFPIIVELGLIFKLIEPDLTVEQVQEFTIKFLFYSIDELLKAERVILDINVKGNTDEDWDILFSFLFLTQKCLIFPKNFLK